MVEQQKWYLKNAIVSYMSFLRTFLADLSFFIFLVPSISFADLMTGEVVSVADGDTITVLSEGVHHKIRLSGIDAPEKSQAFGNLSKQSLVEMVFRKTVTVDYNKRDKYNRIIGKVLFENQDINLEQIKRGLAWHYKKYENEQQVTDRSIYSNEEYLAQRDNRGLCLDNNPIPPWQFRKMKHY
jgi:endonuclease YncB( thermonuclease family)